MKTLKIFLLALICVSLFSFSRDRDEKYQCLPCGRDCDKAVFDKPGECTHCHMQLVKSATVTFKSIRPTTICDYIKANPKAILLDVRTKDEFEGKTDPNFGTLKNAINIPIQQLDERFSELEKYKGQTIVVYCSHSHRSPQAAYLLGQKGFKNVINMSGGMSEVTAKDCKK
jgi:rhodanese-related sulfurtransferase/DNA-directed RNA polymerase subunit RPC12/RpoP